MSCLPTARIGSTSLTVTQLAFGAVPLGNYPTPLSEAEAAATVERAVELGIGYYDVAPLYGHGLAEHRLGAVLRGHRARGVQVSTKVGRLLRPAPDGDVTGDQSAGIFADPLPFSLVNDYSYDGIMRSVEDSLQRLGLPQIDILYIHNIDPANHAPAALELMFRQCMLDGYDALERLRSDGTVKAIGVGNNALDMLRRFDAEGDFDCYMMAGHYHLLDQSAGQTFLDTCAAKQRSILLGSPFASGILVAARPEEALYMYRPPSKAILDRLGRIHGLCHDHGISRIAAALQFPLRHPAVAAVVPGMRSVADVEGCVGAMSEEIPDGFWRDLKDLGMSENIVYENY